MKKIFKLFVLFVVCLVWNLVINSIQNDEIWNYGFAHNIYLGLIPYRDFNMVIPPLYPFLMSLPFHIFGSSMLVLHVENAIILTFFFYIVYKLIGDKVYILGLIIVFCSNSITFPSYNLFIVFLVVLLIYLEKINYNDYIIGFIIGLCILTKHTIGFFILLPSIYYIVKDRKKVFKRIIGCFVPCIIFLLFLVCFDALPQFVDLCILGLFDFGHENTTGFNFGYFYFLLYLLVGFLIVRKRKHDISNYYYFAFASMMLPLFDFHHNCLAYLLLFMQILSIINIEYISKLKPAIFILIVGIGIIMFVSNNQGFKIDYPNSINHFEYRYIRADSIKFTNNIVNYINKNNDKEYIFVASDAYYFRIVLDDKMSYLDLINSGNFGYNGSDKIIKMINERNDKNAVFVISPDDLNEKCQADKKAVKYIIEKGTKIDTVQIYDFYILE